MGKDEGVYNGVDLQPKWCNKKYMQNISGGTSWSTTIWKSEKECFCRYTSESFATFIIAGYMEVLLHTTIYVNGTVFFKQGIGKVKYML